MSADLFGGRVVAVVAVEESIRRIEGPLRGYILDAGEGSGGVFNQSGGIVWDILNAYEGGPFNQSLGGDDHVERG